MACHHRQEPLGDGAGSSRSRFLDNTIGCCGTTPDVLRIGAGRDRLCFQDPADVDGIGLQHVDLVGREHHLQMEARIAPLAGAEPGRDAVDDLGKRVSVFRVGRLL
jgi:hypothetical protein